MKVLATIMSISLTLFLLCMSCSREEPAPPPAQKTQVRKPVIMPPTEEAKIAITGDGEDAKTEESEGGETKTAAVEEGALEAPEADTIEKEEEMEDVIGWYVVKKGESLATIAAREDVYADPLKWPILYRLNMDKLAEWESAEGLPHKEVPEGLRLRILSPDEIRENLKGIGQNVWAVSVLSGPTDREIIPAAITLIRNGYPVYITRARIEEKDWMRLRVGFFENKNDADREGKKIRSLLNLHDSWITKVGKQEIEEFGGYCWEERKRIDESQRVLPGWCVNVFRMRASSPLALVLGEMPRGGFD